MAITTTPASSAELAPGSVLGDYRIDAVAGQGGMGVVYRATQLGLDRPVALKLIVPALATHPSFRQRFERESAIAAAIDHPNVIPVYEAGEADGRLFIAMRFVEGIDLGSLIERDGALDAARAVAIVERVAAALDAAHRRGLVHRDVKPGNVLVTDQDGEHVYLSDFGLTKGVGADGGVTRTGQFVGTLDYVAPEQVRGEPTDERADIYQLGCVLFHALTGRRPFERDSDYAKMSAHLEEPPPAVTAYAAEAPGGLDAVVATAMAKSPEDRYASAGALAAAARAALGGEAVPAPASSRAPGGARRAKRLPVPPVAIRGAGRRTWRIGLAVAAMIAGGAAVSAVTIGGGGGGEDTAAAPASRPAASAAPVASIKVGARPEGIAFDGRNVWVANAADDTLSRIDAKTNRVAGGPLRVGDDPDGVTAAAGTVFVTSTGDATTQRIDARRGAVPGAAQPVGRAPEGVSLGKQLVWVANSGDGTITRLDRATADVVGAPIGVGRRPVGVFVGNGTVWVTNNADGTVSRIDPSTSEVVGAPIKVGREPRGVVEAAGSAWVANSADDTVTRIDARSGRVVGDPIRVGDNPRELAFGAGSIWVANHDDATVTRIDARTGRVTGQPVAVGGEPLGVAFGAGSVWVANQADSTVTRIQP